MNPAPVGRQLRSALRGRWRRLRASGRDDRLRRRWETRSDFPLLLLALASVPLLIATVFTEPAGPLERWLWIADAVIWAVFAIDLGVRVWLAERRSAYLMRHWYLVPMVLVPFLRPLRLIFLLVRVLPLLRQRSFTGALVAAVFTVATAAAVVLWAERSGEGAIDDWGTALWWALATVTTVGYGDVVPVTAVGRAVGVLLMLVGIGIFGVLTASVAAWFIAGSRGRDDG